MVDSFTLTKSKKILLRVDQSLDSKINNIVNELNKKYIELNIGAHIITTANQNK